MKFTLMSATAVTERIDRIGDQEMHRDTKPKISYVDEPRAIIKWLYANVILHPYLIFKDHNSNTWHHNSGAQVAITLQLSD